MVEDIGQRLTDRRRAGIGFTAPISPGLDDRAQHLSEGRLLRIGLGRKVGAGKEGASVGGAEDRHRPTARTGERLGGRHEYRIHVRTLLTIDLDRHEIGVHQSGNGRIGERFLGHDMAPMAGGIAHRQQDRAIGALRLSQSLRSPLPPVDRIVGMQPQVGRGRIVESIHGRQLKGTPGSVAGRG